MSTLGGKSVHGRFRAAWSQHGLTGAVAASAAARPRFSRPPQQGLGRPPQPEMSGPARSIVTRTMTRRSRIIAAR